MKNKNECVFVPSWSWVSNILIIARVYRERESKKREYREYLDSFLRDYREYFEEVKRENYKVKMFQGYPDFKWTLKKFWL